MATQANPRSPRSPGEAWVLVAQHASFEGPGVLRQIFCDLGLAVREVHWYRGEVPDPAWGWPDLLVLMGGPMSVNDENLLPWLGTELAWLSQARDQDVPCLGICLGAQLLAKSAGARVYPNAQAEIGWFPLRSGHQVLHWHGETFDLPQSARRLDSSQVCTNQAFVLGRHQLGLQFHLEATADSLEAMLQACGHELVPGPFIQSAQEIQGLNPKVQADNRKHLERIVQALLGPGLGQELWT